MDIVCGHERAFSSILSRRSECGHCTNGERGESRSAVTNRLRLCDGPQTPSFLGQLSIFVAQIITIKLVVKNSNWPRVPKVGQSVSALAIPGLPTATAGDPVRKVAVNRPLLRTTCQPERLQCSPPWV